MSNFVKETSQKYLASSFIILLKFDYCDSLLKNVNKKSNKKASKINKNFAAESILKTSRYDHATPSLIKLHWLISEYRVNFKIEIWCLLVNVCTVWHPGAQLLG